MAKQGQEFKVGVVTLVVFAVFVATLLWISKGVSGRLQPMRVRFKASPAMPTLVDGCAVLVGGQKVGTVKSAKLVRQPAASAADGQSAEHYFVLVEAEVSDRVELRADCRVFAEGPPLGGDGIVKVDVGVSRDRWDTSKVIEGADPGGFGAVLASLSGEFDGGDPESLLGLIKMQLSPGTEASLVAKLLKSLSDVNALTASLRKELGRDERDSLMTKIAEVAENVSQTTSALRREFATGDPVVLLAKVHLAIDTLNEGLKTLSGIVKTNEGPIHRTLASVETTARQISEQTDAQRADSMMAQFRIAGERLNQSLDDINKVTAAGRDVVVLNRENLSRMLQNFKESSDHLKTGIKFVLRHPWRLLNAPSADEIRQQAVFDAARSFSEAAARIDDATAQLKTLADLHDGQIPADSPDLAKLKAQLEQTQEQYRAAEAALWKQLGVRAK